MRITQRMMSQHTLAGVNRNLTSISKLQDQLTSGKAINQPSDSPSGTNDAMQIRSALAANGQYDRNMTDGKSWLSAADTTLQSMVNQVQSVRDLTVQAMNGTLSDGDRQAIAAQVDQLRQGLLDEANTQVPLFGGATSGTAAYDAQGNYVGRGGTAADPATGNNRRISAAATVRVDVTGPEAFGDPTQGDDLFAVLGKISAAASSNPSALGTQLGALDSTLDGLTNALAGIGASLNRVQEAQSVNSDQKITLTAQLSSVEDVDMPQAITSLSLQQTAYQAALSVASKSLQTSLVDYLR
jgi:flagellar hook-associated protein 3 FlgL